MMLTKISGNTDFAKASESFVLDTSKKHILKFGVRNLNNLNLDPLFTICLNIYPVFNIAGGIDRYA